MKSKTPPFAALFLLLSVTTWSVGFSVHDRESFNPSGNWKLEYALVEGERVVFETELFGLADELCLKNSRWYFREKPEKEGSIVLTPNPMCSEGQQNFKWKIKKGPKKKLFLELQMQVAGKTKFYSFEHMPGSTSEVLELQYQRGKPEKGNNLILSLRKQ